MNDEQMRNLSQRLGAYVSKDVAGEMVEIAPEPLDREFAEMCYSILKGKGNSIEKRATAGNALLIWMRDNGFFVLSETEELFYFCKQNRRLYNLESKLFGAWLYALTNANPAGTDWRFLWEDCRAAALSEPERKKVVQVSYWDDKEKVLRVSRFDGTVYRLDGETITEESNGERVLFNDNIYWKPYHLLPAEPEEDVLKWFTDELINWTHEKELFGLTLRSWIVSTFFTELCPTKPLLVMQGDIGSGKTMNLRLLLRFFFGPEIDVGGVSDKPDGFTASASSAHILAIDNLDDPVFWMRDKLARLSTGGTDSFRKLYTSNEVGIVHYRCWFMMTAKTPEVLKRDDLADRLLILPIFRIAEENRKSEHYFLNLLQEKRDMWWTSILHTLNKVVAAIRHGVYQPESRLRMADWESLGRVLAVVEGKEPLWDKLVVYMGGLQSDFLLESDPICDALDKFLILQENWDRKMLARDLYYVLKDALFGSKPPTDDWPKSVISFAKHLNSIRPNLGVRCGLRYEKKTTTPNQGAILYWFDSSWRGSVEERVQKIVRMVRKVAGQSI
jgi:hypothetical protein